MLSEDIKGLSPLQIKDKFDLPHIPTHMVEVTPPKGKTVAVGIVNEKNFGGTGKGTQFYSLDEVVELWINNEKNGADT